ncbi:hypothetical protein SCHPADRAFT_861322 [Schizopora paradoxa]|uniref:BTB domain-containing protein n=1 Tax=Schizopora paradoxa TaxID=27342 RepID=A0A0H2R452_9AGAM|nr:hypothetical protein SCHPADRAFT_861322 [Schizopora paradoxa]
MHTMDSPNAESLSVHPAYKHADADLKLMSSDGVVFFVHSVILRLASPVFADMVSMPQPSTPGSSTSLDTVELTELADVLAALLDSMYPRRPAPELVGFQFVQRLADAADKYDVKDVTDAIRRIISTKAAAIDFGSPLCNYSLACRMGWEEEAKALSFMALSASLDSSKTLEVMDTIESCWMLKFLNFRRRRYAMFRDALNIYYDKNAPDSVRATRLRWEYIASRHLSECRSNAHNKTNWLAFKMLLLSSFDNDATGEPLVDLPSYFWKQDRLLGFILEETCTKCSNLFFSQTLLCSELKRVLENVLPKQME